MKKSKYSGGGDLGPSVVLFKLKTDPVALEVTIPMEQLRAVVAQALPTTDAIAFRQQLTPEAGQSLALALLSQPSIGGNMLPQVLAAIVEEKAQQTALAETFEFRAGKQLAARSN